MSKAIQLLCVWALTTASLAVAGSSGWLLDKKVDPLTDQNVATAIFTYADGISKRAAVVRCKGTKLDVYFDFGEFLDNKTVPIRYRVDKAPLVEDKWFPSAEGSAVFPIDNAELARLLMNGSTFIIEATDYRGQPHRASFDLAGAGDPIKTVLKQCGISEVGIAQQVDGLRREVALELERWGPKNISMNKRILVALGAYDGSQEASIEPGFALAVQRFYDDYIAKCRNRKISGVNCDSLHIFWKSGMKPIMPPISAVLYEQAPKALKQEAGRLKVGE